MLYIQYIAPIVVYFLCPFLSVAVGVRATSLTQFVEKSATFVSPNKFVKKLD